MPDGGQAGLLTQCNFLFVDGLKQHLMTTPGHNAPSLSGVLIPLLLYADDLIIMPAGLQRQLNALQVFCEQQQLE